jgi:hypothetical protein
MKARLFVALILLLGFGLILIPGCGKDDPTSPVELTEGSLNDPTYELVSDIVGEGNFEFDLTLLEISFGLLGEHFGSGGARKLAESADDTLIINSVSHDSSGNWHIFTIDIEVLEMDEYNDTTSIHFLGVDSLRLGYPGGYSYEFDTLTITSLDIHAHLNVEYNSMGDWATISDHAFHSITTDGGADFPLTINGSTYDTLDVSLETDSGFCEASVYCHQTLINLVIDSLVMDDDACPLSGAAHFDFSLIVSCQGTDEYDSLSLAGNWSAGFVFEDNMVKSRYENQTNYWTAEFQCR